jgi:hypothetical protein
MNLKKLFEFIQPIHEKNWIEIKFNQNWLEFDLIQIEFRFNSIQISKLNWIEHNIFLF